MALYIFKNVSNQYSSDVCIDEIEGIVQKQLNVQKESDNEEKEVEAEA